MPIKYVVGDATQPEGEGNKIIAHCCNDAGKWGKGFVLAISKRWPQPEEEYRKLGKWPLGFAQFVKVARDIVVVNIIGQHGTAHRVVNRGMPPIRYEALREGLRALVGLAKYFKCTVHMPRIGAGLAGGDWKIIEGIIEEELCKNGVDVTVYDLPKGD